MTQDTLRTILLVCTSHTDLGKTGNKTGFWMEELTAPYYAFQDAGYEVRIASPLGGQPPIDPGSQAKEMQGPSVARFEADNKAVAALATSVPLPEVTDIANIAGIFLVGGHGTMWDFPQNDELGKILTQAISADKAVGAVCHGVAGLLSGDVPDALAGKAITGFSNAEENAVGLSAAVPFLLESDLSQAGFAYSSGQVFTSHVVVDGLLFTGQNPVSSQGVADAMVSALSKA
jgi:putative intracellular protease/amidase